MSDNDVGRIGSSSGFGERTLPDANAGAGRPRAQLRQAAGDRVDLTAPELAALRLLRQRVHVHTRHQLQLDPIGPGAVAELPDCNPATLVGRVLAEQVQLGAARRGVWSAPRIEAALAAATALAASETLEILHDSGRLDAATWRVVCAALHDWSEKLARTAPAG